MTLWGQDTVKDVAESVGIYNFNKEVNISLCRDVEYRISQVLQEALKFMKHARRTILWSQDISQALRVLDIEPLYGYESTRPLKYGQASLGPGQPLFYVEDEEMDFEKLINAPLPKVPREVTFTAHWLAVEGVQPSIPQNPTSNEARNLELISKGPNANHALAAMSGADNTTTKPQVKHILSKELQLYFEKVCSSVLDETQLEYRTAGLASLKEDPGLHQLVPYFVQFVAEKVTHNLKDLFVLTQMMLVTDALTRNEKLNLTPYVASMVPPVLTCLIGQTLGTGIGALDHYDLRDLAAALLGHLCNRYAKYSHNLKPRLARSCLKTFLDPKKPYGSHYGAILGLKAVGGAEVVRQLILPNVKVYGQLLEEDIQEGSVKKAEAEKVVTAILIALRTLVDDDIPMMNGHSEASAADMRGKLIETLGEVVGGRIADSGNIPFAKAVLEGDFAAL
ncbi:Transcription initiation factor TFIID subunit 6 [Cladophialophora carrionii]|uniref:TBP-associated factor 6 n=1 Tax=Cladophialophora carrionii TaxID=86049 RepID=A0A1C1CW98_9EURO|nr:Transcription initiation factor TFIID subunit 6 [Cladophialophora carrionii]